MAFQFIEAIDIFDYIADFITANPTIGDFKPLQENGGSLGWSVEYDQARDRLLLQTKLPQFFAHQLSFDPLLADLTTPRATMGPADAASAAFKPYYAGYYDAATGVQALYNADNQVGTTSANFEDMNVATLSVNGGNPWPNMICASSFIGEPTPGQDGNYSSAYVTRIFEGIRDGIPGETAKQGVGVYPEGLALARANVATIAGIGLTADDASGAFIWIDLDTGLATGVLQNTVGNSVATLNAFDGPRIQGLTFIWNPQQFIPDADSTPAFPKGEMMITNTKMDLSYDASNDQTFFIRFMDFNPFGVTATGGAPVRVHERITITSACQFNYNAGAIFGVGTGPDISTSYNTQEFAHGAGGCIFYQPHTRRFFHLYCPSGLSAGNIVGDAWMGYWQRTVDPTIIGDPVALDVPATNSIGQYQGYVSGNLGELVAGLPVEFVIKRESTIDEVVDASGGIGAAPALEAALIDANFAGDPEGTLELVAVNTGIRTALVETTDYTVALATGIITFVTDQSSADAVLGTYHHSGVLLEPSHGTLLQTGGLTDENGQARTRVSYPDTAAMVGHVDDLEMVLA